MDDKKGKKDPKKDVDQKDVEDLTPEDEASENVHGGGACGPWRSVG